jgi:hypothetical protein
MKSIKIIMLFVALCFVQSKIHAQVAIGKTSIDGDAVLDFGPSALGIILPWITSAAAVISPVGGTFIFDSADAKVKYFDGTNWIDMSKNSGFIDSSKISLLPDTNNGVVIGSTTITATGVLVLETQDKGLLLPRIANPVTSILSPEPGTMVFDTVSKKIAVYNGLKWSFWGE